jgi:hypothetical protein
LGNIALGYLHVTHGHNLHGIEDGKFSYSVPRGSYRDVIDYPSLQPQSLLHKVEFVRFLVEFSLFASIPTYLVGKKDGEACRCR